MPESGFFMAIGALGVSLAGFAGLINALDKRPEANSPVMAWRIRNIVLDSFTIMMTGFGVVAFYSITEGDLPLAIRLASAIMAIRLVSILHPSNYSGPAWDGYSRATKRANFLSVVAGVAVLIVVAAIGELRWFQLFFFLFLWAPISTFVSTIRDVTRHADRPADTEDAGA